MADPPPRGDGPRGPDPDRPETKGESDPLFHPAQLKTRKTVMGLAPAPHLGGASRGNANEAEARKQRVLARIASMETRSPSEPPVAEEEPPRAKLGTGTAILAQPGPARAISSDGKIPSDRGWDAPPEVEAEVVHHPRHLTGPPPPPQPIMQPSRPVKTEVMEAAPITARMIPVQPPTGSRSITPSRPPAPMTPGPQAGGPPLGAPLAVRPYEPSYSRPPPPPLTGPFDPRLVLLDDPHSARAGSFRLLRDTLLAKSMPRVVAVSSPAPNEGKTTCAVNLALALSELASTRVLLIDGNFFEPELGDLFSVEKRNTINVPGGDAWLLPYKLVEVTGTLHLAAMAKSAARHFDQQRFEGMIERLVRISYDYIIIDAPAIRKTPAAVQMVSAADGTLLALRSGVSTGRDLRRAVEQIAVKKALGIALIDALPQP